MTQMDLSTFRDKVGQMRVVVVLHAIMKVSQNTLRSTRLICNISYAVTIKPVACLNGIVIGYVVAR